ncbi:MAG: hypothetical protein J7L15_00940 [Clostridiales bacterium]|nr:hypothetical protein [Clostridiales bacterium]
MEENKIYSYDTVDKFIEEHNLKTKDQYGDLVEVDDDMPDGEIGEITLPLFFVDGTTACNFLLTGYSSASFWKCIYLCPRFIHTEVKK